MASSDAEAGELELSSEDDQQHPSSSPVPDSLFAVASEGNTDAQLVGDEEGETSELGDDTEAAGEGATDEAEDDSAETTKRTARPSLDENGLSYASQLTRSPKAAIEQAEESRAAQKKLAAFLRDKAELDRHYAKSLKKLVDKAAPDPHPVPATASRTGTAGHSPSHAAATSAPSTSSFDLALSSFRHLSQTLASNFDLLASKTDEHCLRTFSAAQQHHSAATKRQADEIQRLVKQLQSLHDALVTAKANSKRACMDYQIWVMEHREKQRVESERLARDRAAGVLPGGGVDSHTMFDELVASFRWDAESIKRHTLEVDNRYIAAVKALRSFKPQYDAQLRQLLQSAQSEEEEGRKQLLAAMQLYCDIQTAMFDKYVRNVRAVSAMSQQVNVRREMRAWLKQHKSTAASAATVADRPLPEYVMHKGHPRYGETKEAEERHEHEGITDDEESEGAEGDEEEGDEEEDDDDNEDDDDEEEEDKEDDEDDEDGKQPYGGQRSKRHRRRKGGADELDENEDEKTEERIVAEKVLRVFINKTIGLVEPASTSSSASASSATAEPPVDLTSPKSATLTTPLPASALLPVDATKLVDGSPLDADEEQAAKAIVSTRDGRNAFATIFSSLSPAFHASHLPKSLFFSFSPDAPAASLPAHSAAASSPVPAEQQLTLSRASFNALSAITALFLEAAHTAYHIEPAIFVANVAHQITRRAPSHNASISTTSAPDTAAQTAPARTASPADDVMRKEEVDYASGSKRMTLLAALSAQPLLTDSRFYSSGLFASLHHAFAHSSLYLHRWYSDDEQEDIERRRKAETVSMIGRYERMMRECGVRRRERKRFVSKQVRVFDLLGADEWKEATLELTKRNERGARQAEEQDEEEEEEEGGQEDSPLSIEGLRELASDSEEERQNTLLKRKEEERRAMAEERRKKKKTAEAGQAEGGTATAAAASAARKRREDEERRRKEEEERKKQEEQKRKHEEKKKTSASAFLAHSISSLQSSWFHRTPSPSPTPSPSVDAATTRKGSGAAAPVASTGVRIPIPVAAAVPAPAHTSPGAAAKSAVPVAGKAAQTAPPTHSAATSEGKAEGGEVRKKKVVRRKKKVVQDSAPVTAASQLASLRNEANPSAEDVDDMP